MGFRVSNTDSFIDEVNEEVRRDKLYGYLRRYGWIGVVAVLGVVGGAAWNEYSAAQARAAAEASGDALLTALNETDPAARAAAVAAAEVTGKAETLAALLESATKQEAGDAAGAVAALASLATTAEAPELYRDLAAFKAAVIEADAQARRAAFEAMAIPGRPFNMLAQEQLALMSLAEGKQDEAIAQLRRIADDAETSAALRDRVETLMVALGVSMSETGSE